MIDQPTLFDDERVPERAHARRTDPETSHAAAASLTVERLRQSQVDVLRLFSAGDGLRLHDEAIAYLHQVAVSQLGVRPQSPSGLRTRRRELVDLGYLKDSGDRHTLPSGRQSIAWERTNRQEER